MADEVVEEGTEPLFKLTPEDRERVAGMDADIKRARKQLAALKRHGIPVGVIEEQLEWAEEVRKTLLNERL